MHDSEKISAIKNWSKEDRPREKLLKHGQAVLSDAELLAILIGSGTKNKSAVDVCKLILSSYNNDLNELGKINVQDLIKFKGIGEAKAISILAALEIGRRRIWKPTTLSKINTSKIAADLLLPIMSDLSHEVFWILLLNNALKLIKKIQISSGGITGTIADIRMIFNNAIEYKATSIIIAHNHPSGQLLPSEQDKLLTEKIKQAGKILEIQLKDHLIIANGQYYSFVDNNLL